MGTQQHDVVSARSWRIRLSDDQTASRTGVAPVGDADSATVLTHDMPHGPPGPEEAELLLPEFAILAPLASGAMSRVYTAIHRVSRERFALKVMRIDPGLATSLRRRMELESRVLRTVEHPNVAKGFGFGVLGTTFYVVMELIHGTSLKRLVDEDGPLEPRSASEYIRQAAAGLASAHAEGIVHRDIKPSNLLLDRSGLVKVIDFGMARVDWPDQSSITLDYGDTLLGTVDFMAPEQAASCHDVDPRSDLYALGCTLYYLLSGRPPFPDGTMGERLVKHCYVEPKSLADLRADLPAGLIKICQRMMAKQPDDRYQTALEVRDALDRWLASSDGVCNRTPEEDGMYAQLVNRDARNSSRSDGWGQNSAPIEELLCERQAVEMSFARMRKLFFVGKLRVKDAHVGKQLAGELGKLRDHVALLFALDNSDDAAEMASTSPHLALEAEVLCVERDELFVSLSDLADKAEEARRHAEPFGDGTLERDFIAFETRFLEHQIHEAELTNRSLYDDIGVGD